MADTLQCMPRLESSLARAEAGGQLGSLKAQVRRWQASIGLGWSEEGITDVARYLNATYYGFPATNRGNFSQGKEPGQALRKY